MIPSEQMFLERIIYDASGKEIKCAKDNSHSWTRNAYNFYLGQMCSRHLTASSFGNGYLSLRQTDGTVTYSGSYGFVLADGASAGGVSAGAGNSNYGIIIGTSNAGFSFDNYNLISKINHGNGSGQMAYWEMTTSSSFNANGDFTMTLRRTFNNNSGATIDVKEIGLVVLCDVDWNVGKNVLFIRDVLSSTDSVPNGGQYKVTYTIFVDYP